MRVWTLILLVSTFAVAQADRDAAAVIAHGQKLAESGDFAAAQKLYEAALLKTPDDPDLRFELGMSYFRQHDWRKAVDNFEVSSRSSPARTKTLFYLAESYFLQSDVDQARDTIAKAAVIAPEDAQICQKYGEYLSAKIETRRDGLRQLQKARGLNPGLERIDFDLGKTEFELTDYAAAVLSFETALQKNPSDGEAAFFLAEASSKLEDWPKARKFYEYSLAHGYSSGAAYYGLGRALAELGNFAAAIDPLHRVLVLQPSLIQAHFQLGRAYRQLGQKDEAQREATLFAAMSDRVDTSAELRGAEEDAAWQHVKPLLESHQEQKALDYLATLPIGASPGGAYYLLGAMYFSAGQAQNAERMLAKAETLSPTEARVPAYLGMMRMSAGDLKGAEASFQSALRLESDQALALIGMGGIRYQQQRWGDAIAYLEKSRTADPNTLLLLCDAYLRTGNRDSALLTAEVVRAFGSDRPQVLQSLNELIQSLEPQSPPKKQ
ncbi:MAG TPA: tetratricopeptide repeat protein [Terriglobales bacterium]|nr:tetratricopeptide repeat protein [Terriglobales bacterium]